MTSPSSSSHDDRTTASTGPDEMDTAMGTGSDEGAPGERQQGPPLTPAEDEMLDRLREQDDAEPFTAVEDSAAMSAAAADDAVLPPRPGDETGDRAVDPEDPQFLEPGA